MIMKIKKAVIPIAGKGTRFLPATKTIGKEIIPILDIPMIHYAVLEALESGIEEIAFITSANKKEVEDYFHQNEDLNQFLKEKNKTEYLQKINFFKDKMKFISIIQDKPLGLGHAVLQAKEFVGQDYFAVILPDDIVRGSDPVTKQLIEVLDEYGGDSIIGVMEVEKEDTKKYGIIDGNIIDGKTYLMKDMVEKPEPSEAPSNLATPGRYILSNKIFSHLENLSKGSGGEYQLTDAIKQLCASNKVLAHIFSGNRYDTGSLKGYLSATIDFALERPDLRNFLVDIMKEKIGNL